MDHYILKSTFKIYDNIVLIITNTQMAWVMIIKISNSITYTLTVI